MNDIIVSVIIPVYNVEQYIHKCVDSILNQTYKNIEIILVDDGSPDGCPFICDEYAKADKRVRVVHKKNGGLSSARNAGIEIATGKYGIFVDSDDYWITNNGLELIINRIEDTKADVLNFGYEKYNENTGIRTPYFHADATFKYVSGNKENQLEQLTYKNLYVASAWNKLINMNLLHALQFEEGKLSEDIEWCGRLLLMAESLDFINLNFYCYRQRQGSIAHSISDKSCIDLKNAICGCEKISHEVENDISKFILMYTAYQFSTFIAVQAFADSFQTECIETLEKYTYVLKYYGNNTKVKYMYIGTKVFGLKNWCVLIKLTRKVWDRMR